MIRCRSSACWSGFDSLDGSALVLRSAPRGSYVMIVRSGKRLAKEPNPAAPIGDPMRKSGISPPLPGRTSYVRVAPGASRVRVVGCVRCMLVSSGCDLHHSVLRPVEARSLIGVADLVEPQHELLDLG